MKNDPSQTLSILIGQPLWGSTRFDEIQTFEFGNRVPDPCCGTVPRDKGDFTLQVQCTWRICGPQSILAASHDRYLPPDGTALPLPGFEWDRLGHNRLDLQMDRLWKEFSPAGWVIKKINADHFGGCKLDFLNGLSLEIIPDTSSAIEFWRFFSTAPYSRPFIMTGSSPE